MSFDNVIFDGKTLSDMFSDVYRNTTSKREQINQYVSKMVKLIHTPEDAQALGPVIKDFLEVNVKNDEHIVRLVQIAQRLVAMDRKPGSNEFGLTPEEKDQLLKNVKADFEQVISEKDDLEDVINGLV